MKKLINAVEDVVKEQLEGMAVAHPDMLKVHFEPNFVVRADAPVEGKVALISGGGSGHEPMHGGFVGVGMLDGACPGEVFTSPTLISSRSTSNPTLFTGPTRRSRVRWPWFPVVAAGMSPCTAVSSVLAC